MGITEGKTTNTDATTLIYAKDELRRRMRAVRSAISPAWAAGAGRAACEAAVRTEGFRAARTVSLYRPLPGEVPVDTLEHILRREGRHILLPAWDSARNFYVWAFWNEGDALVPGPCGIPQPLFSGAGVAGPDLAVVPGLAFDSAGRRLGHGRGHFDRLLASGHTGGLGLAFSRQMVDRVPAGPADVSMEWVATELGAHRAVCCRSRPFPPASISDVQART